MSGRVAYVDYVAQRRDAREIERILYESRFVDDFAFITQPATSRRSYGKSESEPGRLCSTVYCREFVAGPASTPCSHCGATE